MHFLNNPLVMRQIIMEHYQTPSNKRLPSKEGYLEVHMDSENCIDDIVVYLLIENNVIIDACFEGVACTISTASTDILCSLLLNKTSEEANILIKEYENMIHEKPFNEELLQELVVFKNTAKQASRIKCALIGFEGVKGIINK